MKKAIPFTTLFLDIGGVLLTNGWDHRARRRASTTFKLEWAEMEERHQLNFATYERESSHWTDIWIEWSSTTGVRSLGLSSHASCSRNQNLTPR